MRMTATLTEAIPTTEGKEETTTATGMHFLKEGRKAREERYDTDNVGIVGNGGTPVESAQSW